MYKPYIPQEDLCLYSQRSMVAFEARKDHPGIAAFGPGFIQDCAAYLETFDAVRNFKVKRGEEVTEGANGIHELYKQVQLLTPFVARDVPGFESGQIIADPNQPEHVLGDGKRLMELIEERRESLPYAETVLQSLGPALSIAREEWKQALAARDEQYQRQNELRELGLKVQQNLVLFRRALRLLFGANDPHYRRLRGRRVQPRPEAEGELVAQPTDTNTTAVEAIDEPATEPTDAPDAADTPTNGHALTPDLP